MPFNNLSRSATRRRPVPLVLLLISFALIATSLSKSTTLAAEDAAEQPAQRKMTDQAISDKVEDELLFDQGVVSAKVDVKTTDGVVMLSGEVSNILAMDRAARIAETVKGVRSVVNRIEVDPLTVRSAAELEQDIESALMADPATEQYEVEAIVENGTVTLLGTVDSYQEQELVKQVVKGVRGVTAIQDELEVVYKTERSDHEIETEIEQALRWDAYVDDQMINVTVSSGKVSLSGTVGSAAEKRMAKAAAWVAGVKSVDTDKLNVEMWARDEKLRGNKYAVDAGTDIESAVEEALLIDPRVEGFNADVEVAGSTVTLRGTVDNLKAKRAAERAARNTVGVTYVNNRLKVRLGASPGDGAVAENIRAALKRDPYIERFDITSTVVDGTAYLYGTVDSYFEKSRAEDLASGTRGVFDVENYLAVDYEMPQMYDPYIDDQYIDREEMVRYERRSPYKSDEQIEDAIEGELWWSPFVDENQVNVTVDDGIATLSGTVNSWSERRAATDNAYEGGATLVDNELIVNLD